MTSKPTLERESRDSLAATIRRFLDGEISAFAFDEALQPFHQSTDPTVRHVTQAAWYHYDDCKDHMAALSKPQWDYFQRLLLLLESDNQIETTTVRHWSWTQLVAVIALLGFGWCIYQVGFELHLLAFSIPFGLVSIAISFWRHRYRLASPYRPLLVPFASFEELSDTYRTTAGFAKKKCPSAVERRRIRSRVAEFGLRLQMYAVWLMFSPFPLLVQAFPVTETRTQVKAA
jgi:hypothetical protein